MMKRAFLLLAVVVFCASFVLADDFDDDIALAIVRRLIGPMAQIVRTPRCEIQQLTLFGYTTVATGDTCFEALDELRALMNLPKRMPAGEGF